MDSSPEGSDKSNKAPQPVFSAVSREDVELRSAYARAAKTMPRFLSHLLRPGNHICSAKLRFRDPNESDRYGRDVFLYLWLTVDSYDHDSRRYVGRFFEVPSELEEWHWVGQELEFESEDVFDWSVNDDGVLHGGFTLRLNRNRLPAAKREEFDRYIGVREWVEEE